MHHLQFTCDINDQNLLHDKIEITGRSKNEKFLLNGYDYTHEAAA